MFEEGDVVQYHCTGHPWHGKTFIFVERHRLPGVCYVMGRFEYYNRPVTVSCSINWLRKVELE